jgi:hypothetical protein
MGHFGGPNVEKLTAKRDVKGLAKSPHQQRSGRARVRRPCARRAGLFAAGLSTLARTPPDHVRAEQRPT